MQAQTIRKYPFVAWDRLKRAINWKQGQHFMTVGGTGSGKTTVAGELLPRRRLVVIFVSKGMDPIFAGPYFRDYEIVHKWPPRRSQEKVLLWPKNQGTIEATKNHKTEVFRHAMDTILLSTGYWCIVVDETHYASERLKLSGEIADMLEQGRSADISMWNNTQRPSGIPLATYVNSTYGCLFRTQEEYDLTRLARMANRHTNVREMEENISQLEDHEFVFLDKTNKIPPVRSMVIVRKR